MNRIKKRNYFQHSFNLKNKQTNKVRSFQDECETRRDSWMLHTILWVRNTMNSMRAWVHEGEIDAG